MIDINNEKSGETLYSVLQAESAKGEFIFHENARSEKKRLKNLCTFPFNLDETSQQFVCTFGCLWFENLFTRNVGPGGGREINGNEAPAAKNLLSFNGID